MQSVWEDVPLPEFPQAEGNVKTDVLIIGGGIAGLLTAYFLQERGIDCVVAEKDRICSGNTGRTTAKITVQHGLIYHKIAKSSGMEAAAAYLRANMAALEEYARLCTGIDCDFVRKDSFVYSLDNREILEKEAEVLAGLGADASFCESVPLPIPTVGAVRFSDQAQFHPLRFLGNLSRGLKIYEKTFVRELKGTTAVTDRGEIQAEKIVCTTHFPFVNKHGSYFMKLYQSRSYVLALENAQNVDGMYVDERDSGMSFRNAGDLLLLGGGGGRTGKANGGWEELRKFASEVYPNAKERFAWAAQDCMSLDGIPYVGNYSARTPNMYVAAGFNKWGMTGAMTAAMVLRDLISGKGNEFAELLSPSRWMLRKQLLINSGESLKDLIPLSPKMCPHLGCTLKWNAQEHSWDCPCHGSRFSEDGKLLDNPSNGDLQT